MRTLDRSLIKSMEASDYSFSAHFSNWGYAHFCSRNLAYYNNPKSKADDAFVVVVQILEPATVPNSTSLSQPNKTMIPYELVMAYAALFNSKHHSDVVFVLRSKRSSRPRKLYAIKKILALRSEYFASMFDGGWSESAGDEEDADWDPEDAEDDDEAEDDVNTDDDALSDVGACSEDEAEPDEEDEDGEEEQEAGQQAREAGWDTPLTADHARSCATPTSQQGSISNASTPPFQTPRAAPDALPMSPPPPLSPTRRSTQYRRREEQAGPHHRRRRRSHIQRSVVHITDASYSTFRGCLYWLYTDFIHFAELSSSFYASPKTPAQQGSKKPQQPQQPSHSGRERQKWTIHQAQMQRASSAIHGSSSRGSTQAAALTPLVRLVSEHDGDTRLWLSNAKQIYKLADSALFRIVFVAEQEQYSD